MYHLHDVDPPWTRMVFNHGWWATFCQLYHTARPVGAFKCFYFTPRL